MNTNGQKTANQHMIRLKFFSIKTWMEAFLRDCKVRELSPFTIEYYQRQLSDFTKFCNHNDVSEVEQITADLVRAYLLQLESTGHNAGGRHAKYRALRAFLYWWQAEAEPEDWTNPLAKAKPPKVANEPIQAVTVEDIKALLTTCNDDFIGRRDKAIILCLLDTGARAREFLALNLDDVDFIGGAVLIRKGKGSKPRTVFIGKRSRKALRVYIKLRTDEFPAVWISRTSERLAIASLQGMLKRRAKLAGVPAPSPHDFRRAFALNMLRAGVDVFSIQRLMGHTTLDVLKKYIAQSADDLHAAHDKGSPADRLF